MSTPVKDEIIEQIEKGLDGKFGERYPVRDLLAGTREVLDDEAMRSYLMLMESFSSLDPSFAVHLLQAGRNTLSSLGDVEIRRDVIEAILSMGRSKWSVAEHAFRKLDLIGSMPSGFVRKWIEHADMLADIDQDVALQYLRRRAFRDLGIARRGASPALLEVGEGVFQGKR